MVMVETQSLLLLVSAVWLCPLAWIKCTVSAQSEVCRNCIVHESTCSPYDERCLDNSALASGQARLQSEAASFNGLSHMRFNSRLGGLLQFVRLNFITRKHGGMLLYAPGTEGSSLLVELRHGRVVVIVQQLGRTVQINSQNGGFNDSRWHKIDLEFILDRAVVVVLRVDGAVEGATANASPLQLSGTAYLGGVASFRENPNLGGHFFRGCLAEVALDAEAASPSAQPLSRSASPSLAWSQLVTHTQGGVRRGCFSDVVRRPHASPAVSLRRPHSHMRLAAWTAGSSSLKFDIRTAASDGLLVLQTNSLHPPSLSNYLAVEVSHGYVRVVVQVSRQEYTLQGDTMVSDGTWHRLQLNFTQRGLVMRTDNRPVQSLSYPISGLGQASQLYFGRRAALVTALGVERRFPVSLLTCLRRVRVAFADVNIHDIVDSGGSDVHMISTACYWTDPCHTQNPCVDSQTCISIADSSLCNCPECIVTRNDATVLVSPTTTAGPLNEMQMPDLSQLEFDVVTVPLQVKEAGSETTNNFTLLVIPSNPQQNVNRVTGSLHGPDFPAEGIDLVVSVVTAPRHGKLRLTNSATSPAPSVSHFLYQQLTQGGVTYEHDGSETTEDTFFLSLLAATGEVLVERHDVTVTILPMNDKPRKVNLSIVPIAVGSSIYLTSSRLAFVDDDGTAAATRFEWLNTSRTVLPARLEHVHNRGSPLSHFTQQDVNQNLVLVVHLGPRSEAQFVFDFRVTDDLGATTTFSMSIKPFLGVLYLDRNTGVHIAYHGQVRISQHQLFASTSFAHQLPAPQVKYTVHDHPTSAVLALRTADTEHLIPTTSFTQDDVVASRVVLVHNTSTSASHDSFTFSLSSGSFVSQLRRRVNITISLPERSVHPTIVVSSRPFGIGEGRHRDLPGDLISVSLDPASASRGPFQIRITSSARTNQGRFLRSRPYTMPVTSFLLSELQQGWISFVHLDSDAPSSVVSFCVRAHGDWPPDVHPPPESCGHQLLVNVRLQNDEVPVLAYQPAKVIRIPEGSWQVINSSMLLVTDKDTPPRDLAFTITTTPVYGFLALLPNRSVHVTSFTQKDINDHQLVYQHRRGAGLTDSFYFSVRDAGATKGSLPGVQSITVEPLELMVNDQRQVPLLLSALSNGAADSITAVLTEEMFALSSNDPEQTSDVQLTIATPPQHGGIEWTETSLAAPQFTVADVVNGKVHYRLADKYVQATVDSFECVATIGRSRLEGIRGTIELEARPFISASVSEKLFVEIGSTTVITADDIHLEYDHAKLSMHEVKAVVTKGPMHGEILVSDQPAREFSAHDLENSVVSFRGHDSAGTSDNFSFYVTNEHRNTSVLTIQVALFNSHIQLFVHGLTVEEGGRTVISPDALLALGPPQHELLFNVEVGPHRGHLISWESGRNESISSFTARDIEQGHVLYSHDGSELASDFFNFSVSLHHLENQSASRRIGPYSDTAVGQLIIKVTRKNDNKPQPVSLDDVTVEVMQFGQATLTDRHLNYTDGDSGYNSAELLYTVYRGLNHGSLFIENEIVRTFRQRDVQQKRLVYKHVGADADELVDLMMYYVSDENPANHYYNALTFKIIPMILLVNGSIMHVVEGKNRILSSDYLNVMSNLAPLDARETFFVLSSQLSSGHLTVNGLTLQQGANFSLHDLRSDRVLYVHTGTGMVTDSILLTPRYRSKAFPAHTVKIVVHARDHTPPSLLAAGTLLVDEEQKAVITSAILAARDDHVDDADVVFRLIHQLSNGVLLVNGRISSSFSQADVDRNRVEYSHLTGHSLHDRLVLNVTDGTNVVPRIMLNVTVYPKLIITAGPITVHEGASTALDASSLRATNQLYADSELAFFVSRHPQHGQIASVQGQAVDRFNFTQLQAARIQYQHDDSETTSDEFMIMARHGNKSSNELTVQVKVAPVNDEYPQRVNEHLLSVWRYHDTVVPNTKLLYTDLDTPASEIIFFNYDGFTNARGSLVSQRAGTRRPLRQFSQQDINAGDVVFVGRNVTGRDSFIFTVSDGVNEQFSEFRIRVESLELAARVNKNVSVMVGGNATLEHDTVRLRRNDDVDEESLGDAYFDLLKSPHSAQYGHLKVGGSIVNGFLYSDLREGRVVYVQTSVDFWPPDDWLVFSVQSSPGVQGIDSLRVRVRMEYGTAQNSQLHANSALRLDEAGSALLTSAHLNAANLVYRLVHDLSVPREQLTVTYKQQLAGTQSVHGLFRRVGTPTPVNAFTQADIDSGRIEYVHDGSEHHRDHFDLDIDITDERNTVLKRVQERLRVKIRPLNRRPVELHGESTPLQVAVTGSMPVPASGFVNVIDRDLPAEELYYAFSPTAAGHFTLYGEEISGEVNFTQSNLDAGHVEFVAGMTPGEYWVTCIASDGIHALNVSLKIEVSEAFLQLAPGSPVSVVQKSYTAFLGGDHLQIKSNIHPSELIFSLSTVPSRGRLYRKLDGLLASVGDADLFSWEDVLDGRVAYRLEEMTDSVDQFTLEEVGGQINDSQSVDVAVQVKALLTSKPVVFGNEALMVLTRDMLNADQIATGHNFKAVDFQLTTNPGNGVINVLSADNGRPRSSRRRRRQVSEGFTYDDVVAGRVVYEPKQDAPLAYDESFEFLLSGPEVPPGAGRLDFTVDRSAGTKSPRLTTSSNAPSSTGTLFADLPGMKSDKDDEYLMQVIIPAAGGGFFVALLLLTLIIVAYRSKKRQEQKTGPQNNYAGRDAGESPTSETSSSLSTHKTGTLRDDTILAQATPVSDVSKPYASTTSGVDSGDGTPGDSPGAKRAHPSTLPRSWNSTAGHVVVAGRSNSDQEMGAYGHGSTTPHEAFSGSRPTAIPPNSRGSSTSHYYKVSREDSIRYNNDGRGVPQATEVGDHINSHESLAAYDRVFDKILDKRPPTESPEQNDGRPSSAMTVLRKNEYWI
ncbi:chondroitin sulfate proteoglycan 4-like isoform X1 [Sycon ciliatum]|uniref:chondroitin sulfate proteoglycan 4-like isoform X1 n=1 Tax=Sycon ciliatum TaxID=27933 RepID=UPI0031F69094